MNRSKSGKKQKKTAKRKSDYMRRNKKCFLLGSNKNRLSLEWNNEKKTLSEKEGKESLSGTIYKLLVYG